MARRRYHAWLCYGSLLALLVGGAVALTGPGVRAATVFSTPVDNASTTVGAPYTAGSGSLTLASGYGTTLATKMSAAGLPAISAAAPLRFTVVANSAVNAYGQITNPAALCVYTCTGRTGDTLTGVAAEAGSADQAWAVGDRWAVFTTAKHLHSIQAAVNALETTVPTLAPLASPALTGTPTAPTATVGTNTTQLATTAFVLANSSPGVAVGNSVGGGAAKAVLYEDATQKLAAGTSFVFDPSTVSLGINGTPLSGASLVAGGVVYAAPTGGNASFALNSAGSFFGIVGNASAHAWGLGFNSGPNGSWTKSLQWTDTQDALLGKSAPATSSTAGFPYAPAMAGAPTGVPATQTGFAPFVIDTTNSKIWVNIGGTWKGVVVN